MKLRNHHAPGRVSYAMTDIPTHPHAGPILSADDQIAGLIILESAVLASPGYSP